MAKTNRLATATRTDVTAYLGYLIRCNPFTDAWTIERDGVRISGATSESDAQRIIEELV